MTQSSLWKILRNTLQNLLEIEQPVTEYEIIIDSIPVHLQNGKLQKGNYKHSYIYNTNKIIKLLGINSTKEKQNL